MDAGTMNDTLGYAFDGAGRLVTIEPVNGPGVTMKPFTYRDYDKGNMSFGAEVRKSTSASSWVTSRSYYGADERLRLYRRISSAPAGTRTDVVDEYRYDAFGRRVLLRSNHASNCDVGPAECFSAIQRFLWDGEQLVWELRNSGTSEIAVGSRPYGGKIAYVHGVGIDRPLGVLLGGDSLIVPHVNWRGAYIGGTYVNGNKVSDVNVSWMGAKVRVSFEGGSLDGHWWGGLVKEQLDASGMLYRRNRYYDAATGRFSQIDPIGIAGGLNLYGFADGDPVNFSDPFGLFAMGCPPLCDNMDPAKDRFVRTDDGRVAAAAAAVLLGITAAPVVASGGGALLARIAGAGPAAAGAGKAIADARASIPEGGVVLTIVRNGRLVAQTGDAMMSHARLVEKTFGSAGLPPGTWVGTVGKVGGQLTTLNSKTIMGNQTVAPGAIQDLMKTLFK
jgi:RHS repeat-associated protein